MFITTHDLKYSYEDSSIVALDGLSVTFSEGWTGIVGDNGAGKSTLLLLLCGLIEPTEGSISPLVVGSYCAQSTEAPPESMEDFALDYSNEALKIRSLLQIEDEWFWRYDTLSHGERKRIQIGCALLLNPAVLALDEPTNHLDSQTRDIVLSALKRYDGVGLLVSHDRAFLDELAYQCLFLKSGTGTMIPGTYTEGRAQLALRHKTMAAERKNAKESLSRLQSESHRRQAVASRSAARRSAKNLDKNDSDGRAKIGLAIFTGQDGKTGLLSAQMDKKVEAARERVEAAHVDKSYDKPLELVTEPAKRKVLIKKEAGTIALGESRTLSYPDIYVGNTDHIGLQGRNGAGKSTFLRFLLQEAQINDEMIYVPQEMTEEEGKQVLATVKELPQSDLGQVLSIVARLNSPPERILSGDDLSPGELRKVMLACGLLQKPYLIVMDEPTNHLDIHSIEALQAVLKSCNCALILVSHDEQFLDALTNIRWVFGSAAYFAQQDQARKDQAAQQRDAPQHENEEESPSEAKAESTSCELDDDNDMELRVVLI